MSDQDDYEYITNKECKQPLIVQDINKTDDMPHIVHCVNIHDDLVAALEAAIAHMVCTPNLNLKAYSKLYNSLEETLKAAKGDESPDDIPDHMDVYGILKPKGEEGEPDDH